MLGWLKRRARVTINSSRYVAFLTRRNISPSDMFVPEPGTLFNQSNVKLVVLNSEGREYPLEVSSSITVERIKLMAVCHFFNPEEAVGGSGRDDRQGEPPKPHHTYRLILVREARPLIEVNQLQLEQLIDNDELLLVKRREQQQFQPPDSDDVCEVTASDIDNATVGLPKKHYNRNPDPTHHTGDFQTEFRRILVTMIEASVRLMSANPDSEDVFAQILDKLERRHRPRVDRSALRLLTEMGFPEAKATAALQVKRNVMEATDWLLEQDALEGGGNGEIVRVNTTRGDRVSMEGNSSSTNIHSSSVPSTKQGHPLDPAEKILHTFLQYRKKWFQPNQQMLQEFLEMGYPEERIIDALRVTGNKREAAIERMLDENPPPVFDEQGLDRDSPIISAILASPVIQLALPKPKTLLALMMLYESPNNANMWLSDSDTHPVVSQILRIYHAEKHSLGHSRPAPTSQRSTDTPSLVSTSESDMNPSFGRPESSGDTASTVGNSSAFPARVENQSPHMFSSSLPQNPYSQPFPFSMRSTSSVGLSGDQSQGITSYPSWLSSGSSPHSVHRSSQSSSSSPRVTNALSSSPIPHHLRVNTEEPMSHSGSPVRGGVGMRGAADIPNGGPRELTVTMAPPPTEDPSALCNIDFDHTYHHHMTVRPSDNTDVDMDDTGHEAQEMDTQ